MKTAPLTVEEGIVLRMVEREAFHGKCKILTRDSYHRTAHNLVDQGLLDCEGTTQFMLTDAGRAALARTGA